MRKYETMFIIRPDLDEEATKAVIEKFSNLLKEKGAEMESIDEWGMRRLAYEVNKFREGYYVLFNYSAEPEAIVELERVFRITGEIIRYLIVNKNEKAS